MRDWDTSGRGFRKRLQEEYVSNKEYLWLREQSYLLVKEEKGIRVEGVEIMSYNLG